MVTFLCTVCKYKFSPRSKTRKNPPVLCPSCSREGTLIDIDTSAEGLLREASNEEYNR